MGGFHHASPLVDSVITCHIRSPIIPPGFAGPSERASERGGEKKPRRERGEIRFATTR